MTDDVTPRWGMPLLHAAQAQKEMTHNEALVLADALLHPEAQAIGADVPPDDPAPGACWVIGSEPQGAWSGWPDAVAVWLEAGWRFCEPRAGMRVWCAQEAAYARFDGAGWRIGAEPVRSVTVGGRQVLGPQRTAVARPTGGTTIDTEARAALHQILQRLEEHGLIAVAGPLLP